MSNITATFDTVWPTAVGLWNLRCLVNGVKKEFPTITEAELASKFSLGSGIHGVNYKRAFVECTWDEQQAEFAWILLNSTIPIVEGWLEELKQDFFHDMKVKKLQFPGDVKIEISRLTTTQSSVLKNSFYTAYLGKRDRLYGNIDDLLKCYRVFKEARNCYMHNGSKASQNLIDAYLEYIASATPASLGVKEVPIFPSPILGKSVEISLRGVVGFSYVLIKILVSLDTELLCSANAESEFISRFRENHTVKRTLNSNPEKAQSQVIRYVQRCSFPAPKAVEEMTTFLLSNHLISR